MPNVGGKKFPYTDEGKAAAKEEAAKSGKKMTMGYKAGGKLDMVEKDGKKVPFYAADGKGKMAEGGKVGKRPKKKMPKEAKKKAPVSRVPGKTKTARGKSLKELGMTPSGPSKNPAKAPMPTAKNNTMPPKPQAPAGAMGGQKSAMRAAGAPGGMGGGAPKPPMGGMGGGMGMPPKKPMGMPGMKKGGKVKKYNKGGKVRGAGIAKQGVRKCKMR